MPQPPAPPTEVEPLGGEGAPSSRRTMLRRLWGLARLGAAAASAALAGCVDKSIHSARAAPTSPRQTPALGAHNLVYSRDGVAITPLSTAAMNTRAAGSTVLVCVGRGEVVTHAKPTDNKCNRYVQNSKSHVYTLWPKSGTALYVCKQALGGAGHVVTAGKRVPADETTLSVVEVVNGGVLRQVAWNEVLAGQPLTSPSVTTTGPAVLVAWWWGDGDVHFDKTAVPDNGFTVIDSILLEGALVQCVVAVRQVGEAGTYQVTWTTTPVQGAQLWIAAVESAG